MLMELEEIILMGEEKKMMGRELNTYKVGLRQNHTFQ